MSLLASICEYRALVQKCAEARALSIEEIFRIEALSAELRDSDHTELEDHEALIQIDGSEQPTRILELHAERAVVSGARVTLGASVELRIDDPSQPRTYCFKAMVVWFRANAFGAPEVCLAFQGAPLVLHWGLGRCRASASVLALEERLAA